MKILVIDDEPEIGYTIQRVLKKLEHHVEALKDFSLVTESQDYWKNFDLIFLDINMPKCNGLDILQRIKGNSPETLVVIMTAYGSEEIAVRAMKEGADDYLKKPFAIEKLRQICKDLSARSGVHPDPAEYASLFPEIITQSPAMEALMRLMQKIKDIDVTVLITGESGTGKELIARSLHCAGKYAKEPFIPLNCSAIPENLVESELFGFEKGSFTGAYSTQQGKFELAGEGTIFLDEIGELPLALQVKLLRVLQEKNFLRIGGAELIPVKCRVITATHQDLEAEVKKGSFREDLFYRLNVVKINLPPLRDRREDIPHLARHFLAEFNHKYSLSWNDFSQDALDFLCVYTFPGNIRELKNIIERIMVTGEGATVSLKHLKTIYHFSDELISPEEFSSKDYQTMKKELIIKFDREYFQRLLTFCQGNISKAARLSGMQRKSIYEKIKELDLGVAVKP
ncbi:MAG: sigma-54 dependent transcriptional regulator [Candidatus Wallbacteria bacterium]|nr:sigma-54 dependent transcriptional regulator [Candidatus Wallbacteria bacterium]